jgi:hypothetical protein
LPTRIEDASVLPHPKETILNALLEELQRPHPKWMHDSLRVAALSLPYYQPGVGDIPLEMLGMDISKLPKAENIEAIQRQARQLVEAEAKTRDQFTAFNKLVQDDMRRISMAIKTNKR